MLAKQNYYFLISINNTNNVCAGNYFLHSDVSLRPAISYYLQLFSSNSTLNPQEPS